MQQQQDGPGAGAVGSSWASRPWARDFSSALKTLYETIYGPATECCAAAAGWGEPAEPTCRSSDMPSQACSAAAAPFTAARAASGIAAMAAQPQGTTQARDRGPRSGGQASAGDRESVPTLRRVPQPVQPPLGRRDAAGVGGVLSQPQPDPRRDHRQLGRHQLWGVCRDAIVPGDAPPPNSCVSFPRSC